MSDALLILPMRSSDLDLVESIADECFPVPWSRAEFEKELLREYAVARVLRPATGRPLVAFTNFWCVGGEVQLMNIATTHKARGHGYAVALMEDMIRTAEDKRAQLITLEVRRSNDPARALYRRFGFTEEGIRPRYYSDNAEDAVVMHLKLPRA
jgi:[ribosomal protein S18]-alanine N-acetyltransferase